MKTYITLLSAFAILVSAGCGDSASPEDTCGEETFPSMTIRKPSDWNKYPITVNDAEYGVKYSVENKKARFLIATKLSNVCSKEDPLISAQLIIATEDPEIVVTCTGVTQADGTVINLPITKTGTVYKGDNYFPIKKTDTPATNLIYQAMCDFPSKGSWEADSIYFYLQLDQFSLGLAGKKVKN